MDAKSVALVLAGLAVPLLSIVFKNLGLGKAEKLWTEFFLSFVFAGVALVVTGTFPQFPSPNDPIPFLQAFGAAVATVFALSLLVYQFFQDKLESAIKSLLK